MKLTIIAYRYHHFERTGSAPVSAPISRLFYLKISMLGRFQLTRITRRAHWSAILQTCVPVENVEEEEELMGKVDDEGKNDEG
jgi:hypothetical protein